MYILQCIEVVNAFKVMASICSHVLLSVRVRIVKLHPFCIFIL